jgi:hypothetical protein
MSIIQPVLTGAQITEITAYINNYRSLNQAPPLVWDTNILISSNLWSQHLLINNIFQHSGNPLYGENLAYFRGYGLDIMDLLKKSVDSWYNEISSYDFTKPGFSSATGHFTCLVWGSSTNFAISISINTATTSADIVFNTSPPGNVEGQYQTNVLPLVPSVPVPGPVPIPVPIPVPEPSPLPEPSPVPSPPPISNSEKIVTIINDLQNIIFSISRNQSIYFILEYIQKVIDKLYNVNIGPITGTIINSLNSIIYVLQKRKYNAFAITTIKNIINQLKSYL